MNLPISFGDRSDTRLLVYALALICPPLLAYNLTPSATQLNELLCVFGWGLCLLAAGQVPLDRMRRGAIAVLAASLGVMCLAVVGSWAFGSLPTSLALPPLLMMIVACFVAALGARVAQGGERDGLEAFAPFAIGLVVVAVLSAAVAVVQVYFPRLADGNVIAATGIPGIAVGNLRQSNHLASLLVWGLIAVVPLVEWGRVPRWLGVAIGLFLMWAVVLSGSRTGLYGGVLMLVAWAVVDGRLSRFSRVALGATLVFPVFIRSWPWLSTHLPFMPQAVGAATRVTIGDSSHFAIWRNAVEMVRQQPWTGVGWGEFNFAWTLTPFPGRPIAFFDHTHDLPLQLAVELGVPLALLVLALMVWALAQGLRRAWRAEGRAGVGARAAWVMVAMIGLHSLDEYPLWYAYFLLPTAWAWGFTLGSGPAPRPVAEPVPGGVAGGRPAEGETRLVGLSGDQAWLRWVGVVMVVAALGAWWDYVRVSRIFLDEAGLPPLQERIAAGQTSPLFAHHADYADATTADPPSKALGALERATHSLLDSRLMMAWANALSESGQSERARYLVARLKEFRKADTEEFFAPCTDDTVTVKPFQCQPDPGGLTWRDFR